MSQRLLEEYLREIHNQCKFHLIAVSDLNQALESQGGGNERVFYSIHGMLTHSGMVSKLIWVPRGSKRPQAEGAEIRSALSIEDGDWLLKSRALRNDLEHYDERIRKWHPESGNVMDMNIGPVQAISAPSGVKLFFNRHYSPRDFTFNIRGTTLNLQSLTDEIVDIKQRSEKLLPEYRMSRGFA